MKKEKTTLSNGDSNVLTAESIRSAINNTLCKERNITVAKVRQEVRKKTKMIDTLHIFITETSGNTLIALKLPYNDRSKLEPLLNEPFLIQRLLDDARRVLSIRNEIVK